MIPVSQAVYAKLRNLATIKDDRVIYQRGPVLMSSTDAAIIVEALDTVAALRGLLAGGELTATMVRTLLSQSDTETVDIVNEPR